MADSPDSLLDAVLHGNLTSVPEPPSRALKLMVMSTKSDFEFERRHLHECVWPELQRELSSWGVDVEILDVQQGREDATLDPFAFDRNLQEIEHCHQVSLGCFLLCLVGNKYKPCPLPRCLEESDFRLLQEKAAEAGLDSQLLSRWYALDNNALPPAYFLKQPDRTKANSRQIDSESEAVLKILEQGARSACEQSLMKDKRYTMSGVYRQLDHALRLSPGAHQRIVCVVRQIEGVSCGDPVTSQYFDVLPDGTLDEDSSARVRELVDDVIFSVNRKNVHYFSVPWRRGGVDWEQGSYLKRFGDAVFGSVKALVEEDLAQTTADWQNLPPRIRKPIQEVVRESQSHLSNIRHYLRAPGLSGECGPLLLQIRNLMLGPDECVRHSPVVVSGQDGSGKSTLLAQVFQYCPDWLGSDVVRIVRHVGRSPCTSFTPELLRNLCLHISLLFGFEIAPTHYSFELGKLSIWFQDLLKRVESKDNDLLIVLDDLHRLRCAPNNQASILGWLPWNLPPNVHIVCSVSDREDRILGLLKTRIATGENFVCVPPLDPEPALQVARSVLLDEKRTLTHVQWQAIRDAIGDRQVTPLYVRLLSEWARGWTSDSSSNGDVPDSVEEIVRLRVSELEGRFRPETLRKICSYLTCTRFGLREAEIVELLSSSEYEGPSGSAHEDREGGKAEFCPGDWLEIKSRLSPLMTVYYVDKRPYQYWSHSRIARAIRARYLPETSDARMCHADLASAFHLGFLMEKGSSLDESKSRRREDWSDMLREIDELWFHLMKSGDTNKLKQDAVCNFDFLLAATRGASISYTRSILEIVRCQMLDWETELLYNMTKQSVDVLSRDPQQLATEILNWLRPFLSSSSDSLEPLVRQAREWCESEASPLLVPQNEWLQLSLPPQVTVMTCPHPVTHMVTTPDSQHALCVTLQTNIEAYHLPSKTLFRTFRGHKARITCLHLTQSGKWLLSGSKDSEIIVWAMDTGAISLRFSHHSSGVQCLTTTHTEALIISGSDSGAVIVSKLDSGQVVHKLENHRGVISSVAVNSGDDIFASASTDRCVCVWSLEDYRLLNTLHLGSPVTHLDLSWDSTFLLLACVDGSLHVRALTTGSAVHNLYCGAVTALAFARDGRRAAVGCKDGKVQLLDVHCAKIIDTLQGHKDSVASIQAQDNDRFLVTAGGNKIVVWNFFCRKTDLFFSASKSGRGSRIREDKQHREPITCVAVSRDGSLAVSGSRDTLVKVWQLNSGEVHASLRGHSASITCVAFSPNGLFAVSGSEDTTLKVWGLTLGLIVSTFQEHGCKVTAVAVTSDSRRVLSVDCQGQHRLWQADTGSQLVVCKKPANQVALHANIVFAVGGKNESSLKFWPVMDMDSEKSVSHSDAITCYTVTYDCQTIVTGSNDMSLKVWEVGTGKLTQVLVGHEGPVTCCACAPLSPSLAVSGSSDCNLIVWDLTTGEDSFKLRGHTETVTCARLTLDGSLAISASDDNTLGIWSTSTGLRVGTLGVHQTIVNVAGALNLSQMVLQLANQNVLPLLRLHNNPTKGMVLDLPPGTPVTEEAKTPGHSWRGVVPQRVLLRGNLKREQSFDSFYWDLRSASHKHDLGMSLEDFRRVPSPFGSREHLHLVAGTVWDGRRELQPKAKLPKHKMLKKQQSMFACFPEFMSQQPSPQQIISPQGLIKELDQRSKMADFGRMAPKLKSLSRAASLEETGANSNGHQEGANIANVKQSSVCTLS